MNKLIIAAAFFLLLAFIMLGNILIETEAFLENKPATYAMWGFTNAGWLLFIYLYYRKK